MKLYLRDIRPQIYTAWKIFFTSEHNIECSVGNIWDVVADAVVSPANSFGFMNGGIDAVYTKRFGKVVQERLQNDLKELYDGELPVGQAHIVKTGDPVYKYVISAPTMRIPENVEGTVNAYLAFRAVLRAVKEWNANTALNKIESILCPGLATSIGEMDPVISAGQMFAAYRVVVLGQQFKVPQLNDAWRQDLLLRKGQVEV